MNDFDPSLLTLIAVGAGLGLIPFAIVTMTAFLKVAIVMFLIRNALGTQQTPPNLILYGIAIVMTVYISTPLIGEVYARLSDPSIDFNTVEGWQSAATEVRKPIHAHLMRFTSPEERQFLLSATKRVWPEPARDTVTSEDLIILVPAFVVSELTRAFEIGFLLYLPFIVIDLVISNILMSMGMIMMSPLVISVPFKLFLFVVVDGWSRLLHGLVLSYA